MANDKCSICLDELVLSGKKVLAKNKVFEIHCGHRFHFKCANRLIKNKTIKCAVCRTVNEKNYRGVYGYIVNDAGKFDFIFQ
jgi:RING finger family protein